MEWGLAIGVSIVALPLVISEERAPALSSYIYIYIYVCIHLCIYVYKTLTPQP